VLEKFVASVYDVYVVRGNSALLRCHVPPAVRDYVTVSSWVLDDGVTVGTLGNDGKCTICANIAQTSIRH
ncbi:hypothetical protein MRX96_049002, partial [Rhipicephalus microplus]